MVRPFLLPRNKLAAEAGKWSLTDQNEGGRTLAAHKNIYMKVVGGASLPDGYETVLRSVSLKSPATIEIEVLLCEWWWLHAKPVTHCFKDEICVLQEWPLLFFWRRIKRNWCQTVSQSKKNVVKTNLSPLKQKTALIPKMEMPRKYFEKTDSEVILKINQLFSKF